MRLIDGDALQKEFEDLAAIQWNKDTFTTCARVFKESAERVEDAKTVDAVCVVRCKNCKHRFVDGENVLFNCCELNHNKVQPDDWFCAEGEI